MLRFRCHIALWHFGVYPSVACRPPHAHNEQTMSSWLRRRNEKHLRNGRGFMSAPRLCSWLRREPWAGIVRPSGFPAYHWGGKYSRTPAVICSV